MLLKTRSLYETILRVESQCAVAVIVNVLVEGNVLHDIHGHGFFMEDAAETGNEFLNNIVFGIHKVGGGFAPTIGIAAADDDPLAGAIVASIEAIPEYQIQDYADADALATAVGRGAVNAGVVIPADLTGSIASGATPEVGA